MFRIYGYVMNVCMNASMIVSMHVSIYVSHIRLCNVCLHGSFDDCFDACFHMRFALHVCIYIYIYVYQVASLSCNVFLVVFASNPIASAYTHGCVVRGA